MNATAYMASVLNSINGVDADIEKLSRIASTNGMTTFMSNYIGESGGMNVPENHLSGIRKEN